MQQRALDLFKLIPIFFISSSFKPVVVKFKWKRFWLYLIKLEIYFPKSLLNYSIAYCLYCQITSASDFPGGGKSISF